MMEIKASTNLAAGDCLGGVVSTLDFSTHPAWIDTDSTGSLFIEVLRVEGGPEVLRGTFSITKSDDDYTLEVVYPSAGGWVTRTYPAVAIAKGATVESTDDLAHIKATRILDGVDGVIEGRFLTPAGTALGAAETGTHYGCIFLVLDADTYIYKIYAHGVGADDCQIAIETEGEITDGIADNTTDPGKAFANEITIDGNLLEGTYALWYKTETAKTAGRCEYRIVMDQGAGGDEQRVSIVSSQLICDATLSPYIIYGDSTGEHMDGAQIAAINELPHSLDVEGDIAAGDWRFRVVARNCQGYESSNRYLAHGASVDAGGGIIAQTLPQGVALSFLSGGHASLRWTHVESAFTFDTPVYSEVEIAGETGLGQEIRPTRGHMDREYVARTTEPVLWGQSVTGRVRFVYASGVTSAWVTRTSDANFNPLASPERAFPRLGAITTGVALADPASYVLTSGLARLVSEPGIVRFWYDGTLEWWVEWSSEGDLRLDLSNGWTHDISTEYFMMTSQTAYMVDDAGMVYFSDGSNRRIRFNMSERRMERRMTPTADHESWRRYGGIIDLYGAPLLRTMYQVAQGDAQGMEAPHTWMLMSSGRVTFPEIYTGAGT